MPSLQLQKSKESREEVSAWDKLKDETPIDFSYFTQFCKSTKYSQTLDEYCSESFPGNTEAMIELAISNHWWRRRIAYVRAVKELVTVSAQASSAEGVRRVIDLANMIHATTVDKMTKLLAEGASITSPDYKAAFGQFERISKIITAAAAAVNKSETSMITAVNVNNSTEGAVFTKEWDA